MTILIGIGGAILGGFLSVALGISTGLSGLDLHTRWQYWPPLYFCSPIAWSPAAEVCEV
jgi:hypothetical protein